MLRNMEMFHLRQNIFKIRFDKNIISQQGHQASCVWLTPHSYFMSFRVDSQGKKKSTFSSTCIIKIHSSVLPSSFFKLILLESENALSLVLSYSTIFYTGTVSREFILLRTTPVESPDDSRIPNQHLLLSSTLFYCYSTFTTILSPFFSSIRPPFG